MNSTWNQKVLDHFISTDLFEKELLRYEYASDPLEFQFEDLGCVTITVFVAYVFFLSTRIFIYYYFITYT